ncbi:transcription factor HIVEP3 [Sardina pilchardus]|uniref:transcription factor HIVEP3 n=1 Tax=Sardina pilchardus TaxID=27697 RepID=UPI002E12F30C
MEALHNQLNAGETSGGEDQPQSTSPSEGCSSQPSASQQSKPAQDADSEQHRHGTPSKPPRRQHLERKRLRLQRRQAQDAGSLKDDKLTRKTNDAGPFPGNESGSSVQDSTDAPVPSSSSSAPSHGTEEAQEGMPKQKRERKPQKPGKYVCSYCGRACAKPSVLQKHIRSHTGERPYPCAPCGFSFKTKSNLYKHRKSHTHRVKAGLAPASKEEPAMSGQEEPLTDSEDESNQSASTSSAKKQETLTPLASYGAELRSTEQSQGLGDSHAVKKRLAMRLSKTKQAPPAGSSDDVSSSLVLGSRGSTESGYFSRSESTEQSQDSPPNSSAKSYAEIILGKYGRLGHLQRASRNQQQQSGGQDGKGIPFTLPKKQVIDHITKLITINEAVVDTSKIDSVKPRRFSLSRRSSSESAKASALKEPLVQCPKVTEACSKASGSITLGVPCQKFQQQSLNIEQSSSQASAAPLLRSLSVPSASPASASDAPRHLRLSQSFDEQPPTQMNRRHALLRRQPAIELPIGCDFTPEKSPMTSSVPYHQDMLSLPHQKPRPLQPYECEECGTGCKDWESYKKHRRQTCNVHQKQKVEAVSVQVENPTRMHFMSRPGALVMRKRRKEDSLELDDPCSSMALSSASGTSPGIEGDLTNKAYEGPNVGNIGLMLEKDPERPLKGISVIQHTSSFEKQEGNLFVKSKVKDELDKCASYEMHHSPSTQSSEHQSSKPSFRKLMRQHNVLVPEILVTEDTNTTPISLSATVSIAKEAEKTDEFQWPQRSSTLAQLPIEKLPPKKKRLRLAEAAQSSGESSFESLSLPPRSPGQDSNMSHLSSCSALFEDSGKLTNVEMTSGRRSRATHTLAVPASSHHHHHHHREMRRSASEQAPHVPQQCTPISEVRSKSFDYSALSPDRTPAGWKERRKCLLLRHTTVRDPDDEEPPSQQMPTVSIPSVSMSSFCTASVPSSSHMKLSPGPSEAPCTPTSYNTSPVHTHCQESPALWQQDPPHQLRNLPEVALSQCSADHKVQQAAPVVYMGLEGIQLGSARATQGPSGAARAHYSPGSSRLKLEIPTRDPAEESEPRGVFSSQVPTRPFQHQRVYFTITPEAEPLRPAGMQTTVAVRVQGDIPAHASAIYTTHSHHAVTKPQELSSSANRNVTLDVTTVPSLDHSSSLLTPVGSAGNKRMLSPSNSLELCPEMRQQQKRVKEENKEEEEEAEERDDTKEGGDGQLSIRVEPEQAIAESAGSHRSTQSLSSPSSSTTTNTNTNTNINNNNNNNNKEMSMPTLHAEPEYSWCYLNYAKPSPSPQNDHQASVYSSWSTSAYNPNPPGLSSKQVLAQLHCKQGHSSSITYTMAPMSPPGEEEGKKKEKEEPVADPGKPSVSEVHATRHTCPTEERAVWSTEDVKKEEEEDEEEEERKRERERSELTSKHTEPPRVRICEGGYRSNEEYVYVRGRGRGRYVCEECGIRCKKPSTLRKHIRLHTDQRPFICQHCNFAFKTKGNLTKHMKSKAHGKKCHEESVPNSTSDGPEMGEEGGSDGCPVRTEALEHQFSDAEDTEGEDEEEEEDDDDDDGDDEEYEDAEDQPKEVRPDVQRGQLITAHLASSSSKSSSSSSSPTPAGDATQMVAGPSDPHRERHPLPSMHSSLAGAVTVTVPRPQPEPRSGSCSSPILSLSPGRCLSPALPQSLSLSRCCSPRREASCGPCACPQLSPSQRLPLSPSPSGQVSPGRCPLSPSGCQRSPGRDSAAPVPQSACSSTGCPGSGAASPTSISGSSSPHRTPKTRYEASPGGVGCVAVQERCCPQEEVMHLPPSQLSVLRNQHRHHHHPARTATTISPAALPSEGCCLLSHLPLHSQPPARSPSLLIPIGGIHMVQAKGSYQRLGPAVSPALGRTGAEEPPSRWSPRATMAPAAAVGRPSPKGAGPRHGQLCSSANHRSREAEEPTAGQSELALLNREGRPGVCVKSREDTTFQGEESSTQTPGCASRAQHTHSHAHTHTNTHTVPDKHLNCTY